MGGLGGASKCGMRCSHTGMRSFQAGRRFVGMGGPPRRPVDIVLGRHEWIWPLRVSVDVHDAL